MKINALEEMNALAKSLSRHLQAGDVVLLHGELGVGKTSLARALIRALMDDENLEVPSPSFALVQSYQKGDLAIEHLDLYRLTSADELIELGIEDMLGKAIIVVEWPERLGDFKPEQVIDIHIEDLGGDARQIEISGVDM